MTRYPPLIVWTGVGLLVVVLLGTLQWAGERMSLEQENALLQTQHERLREYLGTTTLPRVVMIGTSIGRSALPFKQVPGNPPLTWLHINQNGRGFTLFAQLLPVLLQNPPEVLIVQTELLLSHGNANIRVPQSVDVRGNLRQWRKIGRSLQLAEPDRMRMYNREAMALQERLANYDQGLTWKQVHDTALPLKTRFHLSPALTPRIEEVIRELASRGSRIMLIDIPRSQSFEAAFGEDERFWLKRVKTQLKDIPGLRVWRLAQAMADECYSDFLHLKPSCRKLLEPAYVKLASEIRDQVQDSTHERAVH